MLRIDLRWAGTSRLMCSRSLVSIAYESLLKKWSIAESYCLDIDTSSNFLSSCAASKLCGRDGELDL